MYKLLLLTTIIIYCFGCASSNNSMDITELKHSIELQLKKIDGDVALVLFEIDNNKTVLEINADEKFHAASTMKIPVMIEVYKQAAEGEFKMSDSIIVKNKFNSIVDGSPFEMNISDDGGEEMYSLINKKVSIEKLVFDMITVSSNLATNILIDIVDAKKVTKTMRSLGADKIEVLRGVEDIKAFEKGLSNSTTANDLVAILKAISENKAGTEKDCAKMIEILKQQHYNDLIPRYFPKTIEVAHKTGAITGVHHDAGIVFLPNKKSYILVILSKNLEDFDMGTDALAKISKTILDYMQQSSS